MEFSDKYCLNLLRIILLNLKTKIMKKTLLSLFTMVALSMSMLGQTVTVTFNVNMTNAGLSDQNVYIAGDFGATTWGSWNEPGTNPACLMTDEDGDMIYSITMDLPKGTYPFKFFKGEGWSGDEWPGDPNRTATVKKAMNYSYVWAVRLDQPQILADFEDGTWGILTPHVMGCGDYDNPDLHPLEETFMIVDNPSSDAMNHSAKVLKFIRRGTTNGGLPWGGYWANNNPSVDAQTNKYVHVKLLKPRISPVKFKLEGGTSGTLEIFSENTQQLTNQWEEFVFKFDTMTGQYPISVLMPDFEDPLTITDDIIIYIDDIRIDTIATVSNGIPSISNDKILIYPIPLTKDLTIENFGKIVRVNVYNLAGQLIKQIETQPSSKVVINLEDLCSGMYLIYITNTEGKTITRKISK